MALNIPALFSPHRSCSISGRLRLFLANQLQQKVKVISINTFRGEIKIKQCYFIWLTKKLGTRYGVLVCILRVLLLYFHYKLANHCIYISCVCLWIALRVLASHSILTTKSITRQYSSIAPAVPETKKIKRTHTNCTHKMIFE